jgi:nitrogen fixation NifU-like protein
MSLRELYQEIIIDHGKQPRNFGPLPQATHSHAGYNPLCGDKLQILLIVKDDVIHDIHFEGEGCAISMASASMLTEAIKGKHITFFNELFLNFHEVVTTGKVADVDLGKLVALAGVAEFPMRVKCATLSWHTVHAALNDASAPTTTE